VPTVGSIQVADLLVALEGLGANAESLRDRAGIDRAQVDEPSARVSALDVVRLLDLAGEALGDPLIGVHAGLGPRPRGPLFYLLLAGPDARAALLAYARFARVALDSVDVHLVERPSHVDLTFDTGPELRRHHNAIDFAIAGAVTALRGALPGFALLGIDLVHAEVGPPGETARAFGCPVRFDRRVDVVRMPLSILARRPLAANHLIAEQLEKMGSALLASATPSNARERVANVVRQILASGVTPHRSDVAKRLHVSERTLQRQLEQEHLTFREVLDGVRTELSRALLSEGSMKVEAIAHSVGFAEVASFSKAFSRWSGDSPTSYRSAAAARRQPRRTSVRAGHRLR
jgi:AraC-like DNA-binding protein